MNQHESSATRELLRSALSMAARGWHVFPCAPGRKQPALKTDWRDIATTDPRRIGSWRRRIPFNIGVPCRPSGLVVLDLDMPGHGIRPADAGSATGARELGKLCREHDERYPDATLTVRTPSGGLHLIFRAQGKPVPNSAGKLAPRVDVRGDGGYILGYGSFTRHGHYEIINALPPAPLPRWIADLARKTDTPTGLHQSRREISDNSAYGQAALGREAEGVGTAPVGTGIRPYAALLWSPWP
jgi:hypothetical protein